MLFHCEEPTTTKTAAGRRNDHFLNQGGAWGFGPKALSFVGYDGKTSCPPHFAPGDPKTLARDATDLCHGLLADERSSGDLPAFAPLVFAWLSFFSCPGRFSVFSPAPSAHSLQIELSRSRPSRSGAGCAGGAGVFVLARSQVVLRRGIRSNPSLIRFPSRIPAKHFSCQHFGPIVL